MNQKGRLEELFKEFPGIGPRQAKRFVYFLLYKNNEYVKNLSNLISKIKNEIYFCKMCNRFFEEKKMDDCICKICLDKQRNFYKILIIVKNQDFENIEKTKLWNGLYYLINRNLKLTEKNPENQINLNSLIIRIKKEEVKEIVFALPFSPEGEFTKEYIKSILDPLKQKYKFKIFELGRGLSLGSDLEYSDKITLSNAFENKYLS